MVYRKIVKPFFDFLLAALLLVIFSPLMLVVFVILTLENKNGAIFKQKRPGYKSKVFTIYKFRTMRDIPEYNENTKYDNLRLTKLGRFVRKYSIDELPQIWSIFKGDMSFVGPRPLLLKYLTLYNDRQLKRHNVKPGITGWAQVNGRNATTWEQRFAHDIWYVENQSFLLDIQIIFKTIYLVLAAKNINKVGHATMDEFKGNK